MNLNSCIYEGHVYHRRSVPMEHIFNYRCFMMYLDLTELPQVFDDSWLWSARRPALAWFRRPDYFGQDHSNLAEAVRHHIEREKGIRPEGPIRLLTHLRYFGYVFNPVSFYYVFAPGGEELQFILAEITNTPWKERHSYILDVQPSELDPNATQHCFRKAFHVSPFMPMDMDYAWQFTTPAERLAVRMENRREGEKVFEATLELQRREISGYSLRSALARYPLMTLRVIAGIHYQALRLWMKRTPFYPHPAKHTSN